MNANAYNKTLPAIDADNQEFWDSCKRHDMHLQKCRSCGRWRYYPSPICPNCSSFEFDWRPASGYGTVFTYSVIYRPPSEAWAADVPYTYGVVQLDENVWMPTNIVGIDPEKVEVGMRVRVTYDDVTPDVTLPKFQPLKTTS
jgi:hypothetical protein